MACTSSRRTFLGGALAVSGLSANTTRDAVSPAEEIRLGVASYSLREFQRDMAIRMIRKLGIRYASLKEMHLPYRSTPKEIEQAVAAFRKAGIRIVGGSTIYMLDPDDDDIRRYFEYAKAAGMPLMTIGPSHESLTRIERLVKEYGIAVAIHNHGPEDKHFPSPATALQAVKDMDPRVGLCVDVGHTTRTGMGAVEAIEMAGARLLDVHIKDLSDLMDRNSQVPVGDGAMPVVGIFRALKKMGYQGYVNLEYEINSDDPLPGMMKSFAYMRGVVAGLRG